MARIRAAAPTGSATELGETCYVYARRNFCEYPSNSKNRFKNNQLALDPYFMLKWA